MRMQKAGHTSVWAMDGRLALDLIIKEEDGLVQLDLDFDLILTDLQ